MWPPTDVILDEGECPSAENVVVGSINLELFLSTDLESLMLMYLPIEVTHAPLVIEDICSGHIPC